MQTPSAASQSSTKRPLSVSRRLDLRVVETRHRHSSAIVVKDPIAMKYHRLRPEEYFILERLTSAATLSSLCEAFEKHFAPQRATPAEMNSLLMQLHQNGLTVSDALDQGDRLQVKRRKESLQKLKHSVSSILFMRFPGFDPEPFLKSAYPLVRPLLGRTGVSLASLLVMAALVIFATHWNDFWAELPRMSQWLRPESILTIAIVIGLTKVCHELGHAIACKHFGGECHSIGPMLLVFTPALYCDTSDSWMLPSRLHRAIIGMAGMLTEVVIASAATIIWANTASGITHVIAMNVMMVCGISTLLFNANPLLRYDGYYVLSDLIDVPNLGETSKRLLSSRLNQWLLGIEEHSENEFDSATRAALVCYAIAADVYRIALTVIIVWVLSLMLRPYRLESIGYVLCGVAAIGTMTTMVREPLRALMNPSRRRQLKMKRMLETLTVGLSLLAIGFYPLASTVTQPGRIVPRVESPVYVSSAGRLIDVFVKSGQLVQKGDPIARLENADTLLEFEKLRGKVATQRGVVQSLRATQFTVQEAGNQLPVADSVLTDLEEQLSSRQSRVDGLTVRASSSGRLIDAPQRAAEKGEELTLASWSGRPVEDCNRQCHLETGTELFSVMTPDQWDVEVSLEAADVQRINIGNRVRLVVDSMSSSLVLGTVSRIARGEWNLDENFERRDNPESVRSTAPRVPKYVVRIQLDTTDVPMVTGASSTVRIDADPISLFGRLWRTLTSLIRFR